MSASPRDMRHRQRPAGRFTKRWLSGALLVVALVAALAYLLPPVRSHSGAGDAVVPSLLTPAILLAVAVRAARRRGRARRRRDGGREWVDLRATNPPIERIAADLRRLLWQHETVVCFGGEAAVSKHLWALETAITRRAVQAARALDVPYPTPPENRGLGRSQLTVLLRALAAAGLVLPPAVRLMMDSQH